MTLGIVIPLKSKQISRDWKLTSQALQQCLNSILNQSTNDYIVVVCGHEMPDFMAQSQYEKITFTRSSFMPPDRSHPEFSHQDLVKDKNIKIGLATKSLQNENINYWYQLDSDDVLHKDFVKIVLNSVVHKAGALIEGGYMLYTNQQRAIATQEMTQYCGSTSVIASQYMNIPDEINNDTISQIPWARYPHMAMRQFFENELSKPYAIINDNVLGYLLATGDNISDKWRDSPIKIFKAMMKPYLKGQRLSLVIKQSFSIE